MAEGEDAEDGRGAPDEGGRGDEESIGWHEYLDGRARAYWDGERWSHEEWVTPARPGSDGSPQQSYQGCSTLLIVVAIFAIILAGACGMALYNGTQP